VLARIHSKVPVPARNKVRAQVHSKVLARVHSKVRAQVHSKVRVRNKRVRERHNEMRALPSTAPANRHRSPS
jgi:hypothetical protein